MNRIISVWCSASIHSVWIQPTEMICSASNAFYSLYLHNYSYQIFSILSTMNIIQWYNMNISQGQIWNIVNIQNNVKEIQSIPFQTNTYIITFFWLLPHTRVWAYLLRDWTSQHWALVPDVAACCQCSVVCLSMCRTHWWALQKWLNWSTWHLESPVTTMI